MVTLTVGREIRITSCYGAYAPFLLLDHNPDGVHTQNAMMLLKQLFVLSCKPSDRKEVCVPRASWARAFDVFPSFHLPVLG